MFFWLFIAITAPFLPLLDPNKPIAPFALPLTEKNDVFFWLGADFKGRDMLSRTLWGCQRVIVWGVTATLVAYAVGTMFGLLAGYLSGWWDELISFFGNVLLSFPVMVLFIVILNYLGPSGFNIVIAVTFASAPAIMRIVRGLTLDIKTRDYVFAAQTRGESPLYIMLIELLPNARGPIIVDACLRLGYTTVAITTLTFLGLGLQPPDPDWGLMIKEAAKTAMLFKFSYMLVDSRAVGVEPDPRLQSARRRPARDEPARLTGGAAMRGPDARSGMQGPVHLLLHARGRDPGGGRLQPDRHARRGGRHRRRIRAAASRPWRSRSCSTWARTAASCPARSGSRAAT